MESIDVPVVETRINEDVMLERDRLRTRVAVLEESVRSYEVECKASRETVMRLVSELSRERRNAATSAESLESLKLELHGAQLAKRTTEVENQGLMERLEASRRATETAGQEARCLERQLQEIDGKYHASQGETQAVQGQLDQLRDKMKASLLAHSGEAPFTEGEILQSLTDLCSREEKAKTTILELEGRLARESEAAAQETELHRGATQRAELAERQVQDLRERLRVLEAELLTADVHREGLSHSRQHYDHFLEQLSEKMKVDSIAADLGFDMRLQLILSRAEQLVRQEGTALVETKTLVHSLQRKLKVQKERALSKELHTELLRKKVSELEEEKRSRSALGVERDDAHLEARKLRRKVERLHEQLGSSMVSNTELKAQLSDTNELKLRVTEQSQAVTEQRARLEELGQEKAGVERTLAGVSSELQTQERKAREDQLNLRTLRQTLAQLTERERELVDFRMVVSQMVGLDLTALALPNYEIIKHLEGLFNRHHPHHHHHHHLHHHPHLHHPGLPWPCPAQQYAHLPRIQDKPGSPLSAASLRPAAQALPLSDT